MNETQIAERSVVVYSRYFSLSTTKKIWEADMPYLSFLSILRIYFFLLFPVTLEVNAVTYFK